MNLTQEERQELLVGTFSHPQACECGWCVTLKEASCLGCEKIQALIDLGHEGIWTCTHCGREVEWGT